jgi:putative transposase
MSEVVTLNPERDSIVRATTSQILLSSSTGAPAFPSRPDNARSTARNRGDGRRAATRSHAQRASAREHGEDGEHWTFSEGSTVAHSMSVGGRGHQRVAGDRKGAR